MLTALAVAAGCSRVAVPPPGFSPAATNPTGGEPEWVHSSDGTRWEVTLVPHLAVERPTFHLLWWPGEGTADVELTTRIRANSGVIDQGGGLAWRIADENNYYVTRYNPLETNLRVYHVVAGVRSQLAEATNIEIPAGQWFKLEVRHQGERIEVWLEGKKKIDLTDSTLQGPGGYGFWAKADASTTFQGLEVR